MENVASTGVAPSDEFIEPTFISKIMNEIS